MYTDTCACFEARSDMQVSLCQSIWVRAKRSDLKCTQSRYKTNLLYLTDIELLYSLCWGVMTEARSILRLCWVVFFTKILGKQVLHKNETKESQGLTINSSHCKVRINWFNQCIWGQLNNAVELQINQSSMKTLLELLHEGLDDTQQFNKELSPPGFMCFLEHSYYSVYCTPPNTWTASAFPVGLN